jgi:hypothetical protein
MKIIRYQSMKKMTPMGGRTFATTYVIQNKEQREELVKHTDMCTKELLKELKKNPNYALVFNTPMKGFPQTNGNANRCLADILTDIHDEAYGKTRQGRPKDFALAPIERWNKMFEGTDYQIELVQTYDKPANKFQDMFNIMA